MINALVVRELRSASSRRIGAGVIAFVLLLAVQGVVAQGPKKYVMPDGSTVYSDKPVPGGRLVGEVAVPPPLDPAVVEAARKREAERAAEANRVIGERLKGRAEDQKRVGEANAELERARRRLEAGREPKPGERIGTAGGGSRYTDEYLARQRVNEQAVKDAEAALKKAQGL